jgi:hypothetical protein
MIEELAAFAKNAAEGFGHGEDELPVRHLEAEDACDPVAGGSDLALMTARTEVPSLTGEGEEPLMSAVRALESRNPPARSPQRWNWRTTSMASERRGPWTERCRVS